MRVVLENAPRIAEASQPHSSLQSFGNPLLNEVGRPHIQKSPWRAAPQVLKSHSCEIRIENTSTSYGHLSNMYRTSLLSVSDVKVIISSSIADRLAIPHIITAAKFKPKTL